MSEIGERVVVLLSTHIVEDVRDLCPRMAILAQGRVLVAGEPAELIGRLRGRVWRKRVPKQEVEGLRTSLPVISTRLFAGETQVHVLAETAPGPGFEAIEPDLEDVYFATLREAQDGAGPGVC